MKRIFQLLTVMAVCFSLFSACRDSGTGSINKEVYITSVEGATVKRYPDTGSESLGTIPLGTKVAVTEDAMSGTDKKGWLRTEWNRKKGWIRVESSGGSDALVDSIKAGYALNMQYLSDRISKDLKGRFTIVRTCCYTGGEMLPASMFFLSNGVLAVNSSVFTEDITMVFFRYSFISDGKLLKIFFNDDKRVGFDKYESAESGNSSVFKIDRADNSITYQYKNGSFFFFNWLFMEKY